MKFKVRLLRRVGRRLAWREVLNGAHHVGELVTHAVDVQGERYTVLTLRPEDPARAPPIPDLYEPVLLGFSPLAVRFRGFERVQGAAGRFAVVQEWHCEAP
jgi:hypothetical protein